MAGDKARDGVRIDKWLWAARFFKTRSLAAEEIGHGRVSVNGVVAKASREVKTGDRIEFRSGGATRLVTVSAASAVRGSAMVAAGLFVEDPASIRRREEAVAARRLAPEPASTIEEGRPTKRNRRELAQWQRWSVSIDD